MTIEATATSTTPFVYRHGKQTGLDWDAIRAKYEERVQYEIKEGIQQAPEPEVPAAPKAKRVVTRKKRKPTNTKPNSGSFVQQIDEDEVCRLYSNEGMAVKDIAAKLGFSKGTVNTVLRRRKPEGWTGKSGPRVKNTCKNGHPRTEEHARRGKNGVWYCNTCRREAYHSNKDA